MVKPVSIRKEWEFIPEEDRKGGKVKPDASVFLLRIPNGTARRLILNLMDQRGDSRYLGAKYGIARVVRGFPTFEAVKCQVTGMDVPPEDWLDLLPENLKDEIATDVIRAFALTEHDVGNSARQSEPRTLPSEETPAQAAIG